MTKLGAHVSKAGGLMEAIHNAEEIGAECFQIHATSPRMWKVTLPRPEEAARFKSYVETNDVPAYIHAPYLINLATPNKELLIKSKENLKGNLIIANMIGAKGVIYHLGSSKGWTHAQAIDQQARVVDEISKEVEGSAHIILENSAGGGDKIGSQISEVGELFYRIKSKNVSVCIDTAHSFEAGQIENYSKAKISTFVELLDKAVGLKNISCLHVNDSKTAFNSRHDRHENLGEGYIGINGFKTLAKETRLHHCDWILEVPGDDEGPRKIDVDRLKSLFGR